VRRGDLVVTRSGARFLGRHFACRVGRGGISREKREGDGMSPAGVHRIVGMLFRADRVAAHTLPRWAEPIRPGDLWSDDSRDPEYNQLVQAPHPWRHERLWRADPVYDLILMTDWNWPEAVPGQGSAIFVHCWRGPGHPTAGCVAFSRQDLFWIAARIEAQTRVVIRG
jgi:L,D-peptidoglycan transpeptidase YkuD (ErfK/YbiS/YcfS/YnhG family)